MAKMLKRKPASKLVMDDDINDQREKFAGGGGGGKFKIRTTQAPQPGQKDFVGPEKPGNFPTMKMTGAGPMTSGTRARNSAVEVDEFLEYINTLKSMGRKPQSILTRGKK